MSKSEQIFITSRSWTSLCLGTAERRPLAGLPHHECLAPSRTSTQLLGLKWAI